MFKVPQLTVSQSDRTRNQTPSTYCEAWNLPEPVTWGKPSSLSLHAPSCILLTTILFQTC